MTTAGELKSFTCAEWASRRRAALVGQAAEATGSTGGGFVPEMGGRGYAPGAGLLSREGAKKRRESRFEIY